jgi:hypothetical protein
MNLEEALCEIEENKIKICNFVKEITKILKDYLLIVYDLRTDWRNLSFNNYYIEWNCSQFDIYKIKNKYFNKIKNGILVYNKDLRKYKKVFIGGLCRTGKSWGDIITSIIILNALKNYILNKDYNIPLI